MTLRLLLFEDCNRNCIGCCNRQWDLSKLPIVDDYKKYDEIILTGGEPLLKPNIVLRVISIIKEQTTSPIYLYTAKVDDLVAVNDILKVIDGITLTLHKQSDVTIFKIFNDFLIQKNIINKSLRLNVFKNINIDNINNSKWKIKDNIEWIKNCPLPKNEEFKRLK